MLVKLSRIRTDETQTRDSMEADTIDRYASDMKRGDKFPEIILFDDGKDLWIGDGFYRTYASLKNQYTEIDAKVKNGTKWDALLFNAGCNDTHGHSRTNKDKRKAVRMLLANPEWAKCSNSWIAEKCHVSDELVASERRALNPGSGKGTSTRKGKDGKEYPARKPRSSRKKKGDAHEPAKTTKASDVLKDNHGNEVPKKRRDAFADPWIGQAYDFLCEISEDFRQERLADGMAKRAKVYPFFKHKDFVDGCGFIIQYLDQLIDHLKDNRPSGVCPACEDGQGCDKCHGSGLVPAEVYKKLKEKK